jgi:4-amino-4-deoxy-L-arabinose transferase-like glycosyltransferase
MAMEKAMSEAMQTEVKERLRGRDYLLLAGCSLLLYLLALAPGRILSGHAAVLPQTSREMLADHDWLIPKIGGKPWLERPPLSDWIICSVYTVFGTSENDRVARFAAVLAAVPIVLLVGWMASVFYGRRVALVAALIFATIQEFYAYAIDPEADIFLCLIVTAALAIFVRLEFLQRVSPESSEPAGFFRWRSWWVLAFFVMLGLTNQAKGLIFGTLMVAVPVGGYLLWNHNWRAIRRYLWLWGSLVFVAISLAWPAYILLRYPEMIDFWKENYLGRLNGGMIGEPFWYYAIALPGNLLPWTPLALLGLWRTWRPALLQRYSPERLLWSWALFTPIFFSIPDGKHHHYLLHCLAPWAILAAPAAMAAWRFVLRWPGWLRHPVWSLATLVPVLVIGVSLLGHKLRGPAWVPAAAAIVGGFSVVAGAIFVTRRNGSWAIGGLFSVLVFAYTLAMTYRSECIDTYAPDNAFLEQVRQLTPPGRPLLAQHDGPSGLETFWLLFYSDPRTRLVDGAAEVAATLIDQPEVYIVARRRDEPWLSSVGDAEEVLASERTRSESSPRDRRALFRLKNRVLSLR